MKTLVVLSREAYTQADTILAFFSVEELAKAKKFALSQVGRTGMDEIFIFSVPMGVELSSVKWEEISF